MDTSSKCGSNHCLQRAPEIAWPTYDDKLEDIEHCIGPFNFKLPKRIKRIITSHNIKSSVFEYNGKEILVSVYGADFLKSSDNIDFDKIGFAPIDFPKIIFLKNNTDDEPESYLEKLFWRLSLKHKQIYFQDTDQFFFAKNGDLTAFISGRSRLGWDASAFIINENYPDVFLELRGPGLTIENIKNIVGSLREEL